MKLKRIVEQENEGVKFWAENKNVTASLIQSKDFSDEMEIRVTTSDDRFSVRGHKSIMDKFTFEQFHDKVLQHLERQETLRRIKN